MRYLLGMLSPAERDLVDEAWLQDDAKLLELELAETDLIDAYVRKQLSPADRKLFENRVQKSPALLERLRFAEALQENIAESVRVGPVQTSRTSWWQPLFAWPAFNAAVATGFVVVLGSGFFLFFAWRSARYEYNQMAAERSVLVEENKKQQKQSSELKARADQLGVELQAEREQREADRKLVEQLQREAGQPSGELPTSIASIFLMPGTLRGSGSRQQLALLHGTRTVQLKLSLDATGYSSYNVSVEAADSVVFSRNGLRARRHVLAISIPAGRLPPGDYLVTVNGVRAPSQVESVNEYQFRVLPRR